MHEFSRKDHGTETVDTNFLIIFRRVLVRVRLDGQGQVVPVVDRRHERASEMFQPDASVDSWSEVEPVAAVDVQMGEDVGLVKKHG